MNCPKCQAPAADDALFCGVCGSVLPERDGGDLPSIGDLPTVRGSVATQRLGIGGKLMNRYRILSELGRGGMGVVYKCLDEIGGVQVALKALPPELSHNSGEMEEVRENFQLVSRLVHQHIAAVKTLERDAVSGNYFLILELVEGMDLRKWRKQSGGQVPLPMALPILKQIALALDYAHSQRIIHRDIKPGNVLVSADGAVKVLDFGLAAQIQSSLSRVSQVHFSTSGTGTYMAPEQWQGKQQDGATDQYALAVQAYELLAGHVPFESQDQVALRECVIRDQPDQPETISDGLWSVLVRALAKNRNERYANCVKFVEALAEKAESGNQKEEETEVRSQESEVRSPESVIVNRKSKMPMAVLAVVGLLMLTGLAGWYWGRSNPTHNTQAGELAATPPPATAQNPTPLPVTSSSAAIPVDEIWLSTVKTARTAFQVDNGQYPTLLRDLFKQPDPEVKNWRGPYLNDEDQIMEKFRAAFEGSPTREQARDVFIPLAALFPNDLEMGTLRQAVENPTTWDQYLLNVKGAQAKAKRIACVNNLKQIGLSFRIWAGDNNDQYPYNVSTAKGGTMELCDRDSTGFDRLSFRHFQVMSNELSTPKILICPADTNRSIATGFESLGSENCSYPVHSGKGMDDTDPQSVIAYCPVHNNFLLGDGSVQMLNASNAAAELAKVAAKSALELSAGQPGNATKANPWTNSLGMPFVPVAGTTVLFGVWDVRVKDYQSYANASSGVDASWQSPGFAQGEDHPLVKVSWNDAKAFCAWLTEKEKVEGKISDSQSYRLPTDAEWSVAVGLRESTGGTPKEKDRKMPGVYPWGTSWPPPSGAGNYDSSFRVDSYANTSPVGSFRANKFGLFDMGGNVWQWCEDWFDDNRKYCLVRGASWVDDSPESLLSSYRYYFPPANGVGNLGFRCVFATGVQANIAAESSKIAYQGQLLAIDLTAGTIVVGEITLKITSATKITNNGRPSVFSDLRVGERISGKFLKSEDGSSMAITVSVGQSN